MGFGNQLKKFGKSIQKGMKKLFNHHQHKKIYQQDKLQQIKKIGGKLKQIKVISLKKERKRIDRQNLQEQLQQLQLPNNKIYQAATKFKICKIGSIQHFQFIINKNEFKGKNILLKCKRVNANQLQMLIFCDLIQAKYQQPKNMYIGTKSSPQYKNRPLTQKQAQIITNAIKEKAEERQNLWKDMSFMIQFQNASIQQENYESEEIGNEDEENGGEEEEQEEDGEQRQQDGEYSQDGEDSGSMEDDNKESISNQDKQEQESSIKNSNNNNYKNNYEKQNNYQDNDQDQNQSQPSIQQDQDQDQRE